MSTTKYNSYETSYVGDAIHYVVSKQQEKLSDFVRRIIHEKDLSYRKVAASSGGLITHSTVSDVVNERVSNLSSQSISGLAKGLGVTESEIFSLVRGKLPNQKMVTNQQFENLSLKFSGIPSTKKERAQALLDMLDREFDRLANEK